MPAGSPRVSFGICISWLCLPRTPKAAWGAGSGSGEVRDEDGGGRGADVAEVWGLAPHLGSTRGAGRPGWVSRGHVGGMAQGPVGSQPPVGPSHCRRACPRSKAACSRGAPAQLAEGENFQKPRPGCVSDGCRTFPDLLPCPFPRRILLVLGEQTPPHLPAALLALAHLTPRDEPRLFFSLGWEKTAGFGVAGLAAGRHCLRRRQTGSGGGTFPSWKAGSDYVFARSLKITGRSLL